MEMKNQRLAPDRKTAPYQQDCFSNCQGFDLSLVVILFSRDTRKSVCTY
ncbi:hypothetical protein Pcar_3275 [Syntrophotalea carbinolica DSM 2380]|uniref:Uncharacterized protein n=1 Tax=Syntrophotalea carbinolica (strain DSM 2380 / NBRC 103641 / GraBd1) TaxID=338963 RepID=Q0C6P2_SYNC1|nr:hypothetical protein Pcar_3275 [Syntrophotalea carbinolica DSM 2380]